jgi:transcriptional regulator with PAS, ATPase and Fis domain
MIDRVAPLDTTVILFGETGVGKEVFAKYIYQHSARKNKPFIKVNCGAIPANLVESELFGYEKGAFTGADKNGKMGLFELANTGTIFLDEVGELPLDMQVKLLRVLQEQEFERIGGRKPVKVDVRVLAATNRDLEEMVKQKTFRQDLYYRLMIFPVHIPPLREHPDDILPLAQLFLQTLNRKYDFKKYLSPLSAKMMQDYSWPGNIRELRNIIERAVIISNEDEIGPDALHLFTVEDRPETKSRVLDPVKDLKTAMEELELEYINHAYEKYGNVREAAESLGMTPSTFVRKRQKYTKNVD